MAVPVIRAENQIACILAATINQSPVTGEPQDSARGIIIKTAKAIKLIVCTLIFPPSFYFRLNSHRQSIRQRIAIATNRWNQAGQNSQNQHAKHQEPF